MTYSRITQINLLLSLLLLGGLLTGTSYGYGELQWAGSWPYGRAEAVTLDKARDLAFLGSGGAVLVLDVSDPTTPQLISDRVRTKGYVTGLDFDPVTWRLYIAAGEGGFEIWDIRDPSAPVQLSTMEVYYFNVEVPVERVYYKNNFAYLACSWGYVHWLDVTDPENPVHKGFNGATGNSTMDLFIGDDGFAYAAGPKYVRFDIEPDGSLHSAGFNEFFDPFCSYAAGKGEIGYLGYGSTLYILDLTQGFFPIWSSVYTGGVAHMVLEGDLAYIATGGGIHVLEVINPLYPETILTFDNVGSALGLAIDGNLAYVAAGHSGLRVVDMGLTESRDTVEIGFYETYNATWHSAVVGDVAYLAAEEDGLLAVDISVPLKSHVIGQYDSPGGTRDVVTQDNLAYIADWDGGFRIVDISDPTNLFEVGALEGMYVWRVAVSGQHAFIIEGPANQIETLRSIDVSDPSNPVAVGEVSLSGMLSWEIIIQDDVAYIAEMDNGLGIFDISDPTQPVKIGVYPAPDVWDVDVQGDYAYVASTDWQGGLLILDISRPASPELVSKYNPSGWFHPYKVEVNGTYAYVTRDDELYLFDVSDPADPQQKDVMTLPQGISELFSEGNRLYVADVWAGLHILDVTAPTDPLQSDKTKLLYGTGGYVNFSLTCGVENAGRNYLMLATLSGSAPGILLPGGAVTLPLNWDVFTSFVLAYINTQFFADFHGTLNGLGNGTAQFYTMGPPIGLNGQTITFAFALYGPWDFVSNPVDVEIVPY